MESEAGSAMEFMKEMLSTVKERMKSKLVSSFAIAWLIYNYQLLLVIVGEGKFSEKLYFITNELKFDGFSLLSPNFLYPVIISLFYIWFVPVIEGGVYYLQMFFIGVKKRLMMKADNIPPVSRVELDVELGDRDKTIKRKEDEIATIREAFAQKTTNLTSEVHHLTDYLYRQIILRFIAESGLSKVEYNVLAAPANGFKLKSSVSKEFRETPVFNGFKCFFEITNKIRGHHDTEDRFISRDVLNTALDRYLNSDDKYDFIYLLKAMRLISDGSGWAVNEYMLSSDDRAAEVNAFLEQLIAEPNPQST